MQKETDEMTPQFFMSNVSYACICLYVHWNDICTELGTKSYAPRVHTQPNAHYYYIYLNLRWGFCPHSAWGKKSLILVQAAVGRGSGCSSDSNPRPTVGIRAIAAAPHHLPPPPQPLLPHLWNPHHLPSPCRSSSCWGPALARAREHGAHGASGPRLATQWQQQLWPWLPGWDWSCGHCNICFVARLGPEVFPICCPTLSSSFSNWG